MNDVLFAQRGGLAVATLSRPAALNTLTLDMVRALEAQLVEWSEDPSVRAVLVRGAGERAFCAGGDVRAIYQARHQPGDYGSAMFREEFRLIRRIHRLRKPWVALAHGITMGGGAGLSLNGAYCVATETSLFAMPEVFIGSFPDVGATRFLGRCPGRIGLYLALTGSRAGAADALYCGLATHFVPQDRLDALSETLAAVDWRREDAGAQVEAVLARFRRPPAESRLAALRPAIDRCFAEGSVEAIVAALQQERESWAKEALAAMARASPTSLKLAFRLMQGGGKREIEEALVLEYRAMQQVMNREDFFEGVRALLVDKDRKPRWRPSSLAGVTDEDVERHFADLGDGELRFA